LRVSLKRLLCVLFTRNASVDLACRPPAAFTRNTFAATAPVTTIAASITSTIALLPTFTFTANAPTLVTLATLVTLITLRALLITVGSVRSIGRMRLLCGEGLLPLLLLLLTLERMQGESLEHVLRYVVHKLQKEQTIPQFVCVKVSGL
jgi:hypothetical protein